MKLDRYQTEAGIVCIITSFANVLSYVGKPIDDSTLFLLGDGFVLDYSMEQAQSIKDIILHHYSNSAIYRFFNRYGIPMSIAPFCDNMEEFKNRARQYISSDIPIITLVSTKGLNYHQVFTELKDERRHVIVVMGIDDNQLYISDCYIPTLPKVSFFQGPVSFNSMEAAYCAINWEFYDIDYMALKNANIDTSKDVLLDALHRNIGFHLDGENSNINKLYSFANDIPTMLERFGEEEIRANIKELYFYIKSNGIVPSRLLLRKFLIQLQENHNLHLQAAISNIDELIKMWETFSIYFIKSGLGTKLSNTPFLNSREKLHRIIRSEEEVFKDLLLRI